MNRMRETFLLNLVILSARYAFAVCGKLIGVTHQVLLKTYLSNARLARRIVMTNDDLTGRIIGCAYKVHNTLGTGFLEKVYENALKIELVKLGHNIKQQEPVAVWYEGIQVGEYFPDLWVDDLVIVEIKAVLNLAKEHEVKLVHCLTATGVNDGLLINFGASVQVKRKFRVYKSKTSLADALIAEISHRAEP